MSAARVYPTGTSCADCGAQTFFVPGYMVRNEDGARWFTVAQQTDHDVRCRALVDEAD